MLSSTVNDKIFAKEVLTQFDMKDSRLSYPILREALVRFVELTDDMLDDNVAEYCPHCEEEL